MLFVLDNYDSFTYNLVQYLGELGEDLRVFRNDKITVQEIERLKPTRIVISPGPGTPVDAGVTEDVIRHFHKTIPILGVCLGHQAIGEVFGGKIVRALDCRSPSRCKQLGALDCREHPSIGRRACRRRFRRLNAPRFEGTL